MKPYTLCLVVLIAVLAAPAMAEHNVPPPGFTALFNGRDLSGWYGWGTQDPTDLAKMTVYVTNLDEYRAARVRIGTAWKARLGKHFPAMALVCVAGLLEPRAKVEIEALAVLENG
jgi:hypothetical protein